MTQRWNFDADELLDRIKSGERLPRDVVAQVAATLSDPDYEDKYGSIYILGRGYFPEYRPLVEAYLKDVSEPMLTRIALMSLTSFWDLRSEYLDELVRFAKGVSWDDEDDVRLLALTELGEHLRSNPKDDLLLLLFNFSEDNQEEEITREVALAALARAIGYEHRDIPSAARPEPLDSSWSLTVKQQARERLRSAR